LFPSSLFSFFLCLKTRSTVGPSLVYNRKIITVVLSFAKLLCCYVNISYSYNLYENEWKGSKANWAPGRAVNMWRCFIHSSFKQHIVTEGCKVKLFCQ
jgi:hypothetical protein